CTEPVSPTNWAAIRTVRPTGMRQKAGATLTPLPNAAVVPTANSADPFFHGVVFDWASKSAAPSAMAVAWPDAFTTATCGFDEAQVTDPVSPGTCATSRNVWPMLNSRMPGLTIIPNPATGITPTETSDDPCLDGSNVDAAETRAAPFAIPVTRPVLFTTACCVLDVAQVTVVGAPPLVATLAINCCCAPGPGRMMSGGSTLTDCTALPTSVTGTSAESSTRTPSLLWRLTWITAIAGPGTSVPDPAFVLLTARPFPGRRHCPGGSSPRASPQ